MLVARATATAAACSASLLLLLCWSLHQCSPCAAAASKLGADETKPATVTAAGLRQQPLGTFDPSPFDVEWNEASTLETESMPLGNGDLSLSVWLDNSTGDVSFYAQTSGAYDENALLLKTTRGTIRVTAASNTTTTTTTVQQHSRSHTDAASLNGTPISLNYSWPLRSLVHTFQSAVSLLSLSWLPRSVQPIVERFSAEAFNIEAHKAAPAPVAAPALTFVGHHLHLRNLSQTISFVRAGLAVQVTVWVDRHAPVAHFAVNASQPVHASVSIDMWRTVPIPVDTGGYYCDQSQRFVYPDTLWLPSSGEGGIGRGAGELLWFHRNDNATAGSSRLPNAYLTGRARQGLSETGAGSTLDPLVNRTFGGFIRQRDQPSSWSTANINETAKGLIASLDSLLALDSFAFDLFVHAAQTLTAEAYVEQLGNLTTSVDAQPLQAAFAAHVATWSDLFNRSHVLLSLPGEPDLSYRLNQLMLLQRVQDHMDGLGGFPIHFNGQSFSIGSFAESTLGPDSRPWGSAYWWQNTRHMYWPALQSGDSELLLALFTFYHGLLPVLQECVSTYYNHSGAFFEETMAVYGLPVDAGYGYDCDGTAALHDTNYIRYHWDGSIELCLMMVQYYQQSNNDTFGSSVLLPFCTPVMEFFRLHFPERDIENRTVFYPSQGLETWQCPNAADPDQCVTNSVVFISGLQTTLTALLQLPDSLIPDSAELREEWTAQLSSLPPVPRGPCPSNTSLSCVHPASRYNSSLPMNSENVELYTLWPFNLYGLGRPGLEVALNSYQERRYPCNYGWCQDLVDAAYLGLRDELAAAVVERVQAGPAVGWKFPTFVGPMQDATPAADHISVLRMAVQTALLQEISQQAFDIRLITQPHKTFTIHTDSRTEADSRNSLPRRQHVSDRQATLVQRTPVSGSVLLLFPSLPADWDVDFKLWASGGTVVQATCTNNSLTRLVVTPTERMADVVLMNCLG